MNLVDTFLLLLQSATSQGILWALLAIGVFLTFRILDIADLTAEGSFPLGAGIAAISITNGVSPHTSQFDGLWRWHVSRLGIRTTAYKTKDPSLVGRDHHDDWALFHHKSCDGCSQHCLVRTRHGLHPISSNGSDPKTMP